MKLRLREARPAGGELQKNPDKKEEDVWRWVEERLRTKQNSENQDKGV
jgi:hypothetical protein